MNQQEIEDMNLHRAIRTLPEYSPSDDLWLDIINVLDKEDREQTKLSAALQRLPQYEAPAMTWAAIELDLPKAKQDAKIFSMGRRWAAAASIVGIIGSGLWWYSAQRAVDSVTYAYSTEKVDSETLANNQKTHEEDEQAFAMVNQICEQQAFVCEQPEVKKLRSELDELNQAYAEIKEALGAYSDDSDLQQRLLSIEQERTEVLKKIMTEI
jgi:hypothetical protein